MCARGGASGDGALGALRALVTALLLVTVVTAADTDAGMSQMAPAPFLVGSRYGRSSPRLISPRNDKFFMGSRYGKRSDPLSSSLWDIPQHHQMMVGPHQPTQLLCDYTGVYTLYRCRNDNSLHDRKLPEHWTSSLD